MALPCCAADIYCCPTRLLQPNNKPHPMHGITGTQHIPAALANTPAPLGMQSRGRYASHQPWLTCSLPSPLSLCRAGPPLPPRPRSPRPAIPLRRPRPRPSASPAGGGALLRSGGRCGIAPPPAHSSSSLAFSFSGCLQGSHGVTTM